MKIKAQDENNIISTDSANNFKSILQNVQYIQMIESPELTHCNKTERVTIFKIPPLSTTKDYHLDDWKEMIWQGGVKVTQKDKVITITFIEKTGKVFAQTKVPTNHRQAIVKTKDSSRGYAVRLQKPNGGYYWIGVAFRDRNDAFDFGVVFQDYSDRQKLNSDPNSLNKQFGEEIDFSVKKGEKIKINVGGEKKKKESGNSNADFFSFDMNEKKEEKPKKEEKKEDWFSDFDFKKDEKKKSNDFDLL